MFFSLICYKKEGVRHHFKGTETGVKNGVLTAAATDLSGAADLTAALKLLAAGDGGTNAAVTWGTYNGNTYLVEDLTDGALATTDVVVELTGTLDLLSGTNLLVTFN